MSAFQWKSCVVVALIHNGGLPARLRFRRGLLWPYYLRLCCTMWHGMTHFQQPPSPLTAYLHVALKPIGMCHYVTKWQIQPLYGWSLDFIQLNCTKIVTTFFAGKTPPTDTDGSSGEDSSGLLDLVKALMPLFAIIAIALSMLVIGYIFVPPCKYTTHQGHWSLFGRSGLPDQSLSTHTCLYVMWILTGQSEILFQISLTSQTPSREIGLRDCAGSCMTRSLFYRNLVSGMLSEVLKSKVFLGEHARRLPSRRCLLCVL